MRIRTWLLLCLVLCSVAGPAQVPDPTVIGPIPATVSPGDPSHDYPFFSTTVDLASCGYVEEEFFFEGTANRYTISSPLATATVLDRGHPYRTRMVVRRPMWPRNFNGTVIMEWQTAPASYDFDGLWLQFYDHFMRRGYAWIGVSAQQGGVHNSAKGLKAWSPTRYGTLDVTQSGTILDNALAYDIFSQAAQAVKSPRWVDPMGGLRVELIFAASVLGNLVTYHNSIHPLAGVFDAFLSVGSGGRFRTDLDVKVFKFLSEAQVANTQAAVRQPDSEHFRRWEVAGTADHDFHLQRGLELLQSRDFGTATSASCNYPPYSRIPLRFAGSAALDHLLRWVKDNVQPPSAPEIEIVALGPPVVVARDTYGNALGGIRLSQHAVPTATNGVNSGPGLCWNLGTFQPFDAGMLASLYPEHGGYVSRIVQRTEQNLQNGFIVVEDAIDTIREGAQSDIGKH